jgi:hypothetical protein
MKLRSENVPDAVVLLFPMVETWGIGDDYDRERKVADASDVELLELVRCLDDIDENVLFEWLEGPESHDSNPSDEYVAFTCFTMAIESAKVKIKDRGLANRA